MSKCDQCGAVDPDDIHTCGVVQPVAYRVKWPTFGGGYKWIMAPQPTMVDAGFVNQALYTNEQYTALEKALTRLQKRYGELEAKVAAQPARTERQIADQTEELAVWLLSWNFNLTPNTGRSMRESINPFAKSCWLAACHIQEMLTATDPENAAAELDGEAQP